MINPVLVLTYLPRLIDFLSISKYKSFLILSAEMLQKHERSFLCLEIDTWMELPILMESVSQWEPCRVGEFSLSRTILLSKLPHYGQVERPGFPIMRFLAMILSSLIKQWQIHIYT